MVHSVSTVTFKEVLDGFYQPLDKGDMGDVCSTTVQKKSGDFIGVDDKVVVQFRKLLQDSYSLFDPTKGDGFKDEWKTGQCAMVSSYNFLAKTGLYNEIENGIIYMMEGFTKREPASTCLKFPTQLESTYSRCLIESLTPLRDFLNTQDEFLRRVNFMWTHISFRNVVSRSSTVQEYYNTIIDFDSTKYKSISYNSPTVFIKALIPTASFTVFVIDPGNDFQNIYPEYEVYRRHFQTYTDDGACGLMTLTFGLSPKYFKTTVLKDALLTEHGMNIVQTSQTGHQISWHVIGEKMIICDNNIKSGEEVCRPYDTYIQTIQKYHDIMKNIALETCRINAKGPQCYIFTEGSIIYITVFLNNGVRKRWDGSRWVERTSGGGSSST